MAPQARQDTRSIDVTGLTEEAIQAVESLVTLLKKQGTPQGPSFASPEEWIKAINEWAASHKSHSTPADWSRETIYGGRGE